MNIRGEFVVLTKRESHAVTRHAVFAQTQLLLFSRQVTGPALYLPLRLSCSSFCKLEASSSRELNLGPSHAFAPPGPRWFDRFNLLHLFR